MGLLPHCTEAYIEEYKKRTVIERGFSSQKHSRLLVQHRYIGIDRISLHVLLSLLVYLATALAHLQADDYAHMRHMRIKLPSVRCERAKQRLGRSCRATLRLLGKVAPSGVTPHHWSIGMANPHAGYPLNATAAG